MDSSEEFDEFDEPEGEPTSVIRLMDRLRINLSLPDLGHPDKPDLWAEIHGGNRRKDPKLVCGKGHPKAVAQRRNGTRYAYHLVESDKKGHQESPAHLALKEWGYRAALDGGFTADREWTSPSGKVRNDVHIIGAGGVEVGFEAQYSRTDAVSDRSGFARSNRMLNEGITPLWVAPQSNQANIDQKIPSAIYPDMEWQQIIPGRPIITRAGVSMCHLERHSASPDACPRRKGRGCGGWHARFTPKPGVELSEMVGQVATADLIVVRRPAKTIRGSTTSSLHFTTPADRDRYDECGGILLALKGGPTSALPPQVRAQPRREFTEHCSKSIPEPAAGPAAEAVTTTNQNAAGRGGLRSATPRGTCGAGVIPCGAPARLYPAGWRCAEHI